MLSQYFARNVSPIYGRNDDITIIDVSACNYVIIVRKNAIVVYIGLSQLLNKNAAVGHVDEEGREQYKDVHVALSPDSFQLLFMLGEWV